MENSVGLLREELSGESGGVRGTVRIGTPEGFGTVFLTPRLAPPRRRPSGSRHRTPDAAAVSEPRRARGRHHRHARSAAARPLHRVAAHRLRRTGCSHRRLSEAPWSDSSDEPAGRSPARRLHRRHAAEPAAALSRRASCPATGCASHLRACSRRLPRSARGWASACCALSRCANRARPGAAGRGELDAGHSGLPRMPTGTGCAACGRSGTIVRRVVEAEHDLFIGAVPANSGPRPSSARSR